MIERRSLLSWLGASVTSALGSHSLNAAARDKSAGVVALESFAIADAEQMPRVHAYLGGVLLPLLNQVQHRPGICLESMVVPQNPHALVVSAFSSFDEMQATRRRIAGHPDVQKARAQLESAAVLTEVRSQLFIGAQEPLRLPLKSGRLNSAVFELRSYHCPTWEAGPPASLTAVLNRAGIHPVLNAAVSAAEHSPQFTYLIPFQSLAARAEAWSRLGSDPHWLAIERESVKDGSGVRVTAKSIYRLAPNCRLA